VLAPGVRLLADDLNNASVIDMAKRGLTDDAIIAQIKDSHNSFSLADPERLRLRQARISARVIAAMIEASVMKEARVTLDGKPVVAKTLAQARTSGGLGRLLSGGPKSVKAYLEGAFSEVTTGATPVIEIQLPASDSIDNFLLLRLEPSKTRRELEVASGGGAPGAKTVFRADSLVTATPEVVRPGLYRLTVGSPLVTGEYMLYVLGSADFQKGIYGKGYDFGVRIWVD
jgi:hypothetical protein